MHNNLDEVPSRCSPNETADSARACNQNIIHIHSILQKVLSLGQESPRGIQSLWNGKLQISEIPTGGLLSPKLLDKCFVFSKILFSARGKPDKIGLRFSYV